MINSISLKLVAWKFAESSALVSGLGYGGIHSKTQTPNFSACENIDILGVEFGSSPKTMMDAWNKFTANWLRYDSFFLIRSQTHVYSRYVYQRVPISALKLPTTFFVSAFWHGYYVGYYTTFLSSVLMTEAARSLRRSLRPLFIQPSRLSYLKPLYDLIGILLSMFCLNYLVVSFILRYGDKVWVAWSSIYFIGHVGMFGAFFLLNFTPLGKMLRSLHPKQESKPKKE